MYIKFDKGAKYASVRNIGDGEQSESLDGFDDAGYILRDNDVVVDIDDLDKGVIKALIEMFDINTQIVWTDRGAHLYFVRPPGFNRARGITPLGFKAEYKTSSNTKAVTIKRNGEKRPVDNEGIRERLPEIFIPNKKYKNMLGLGEGDGRNDYLHSHKFKIARLEDQDKILRFINEYIFETPLDEDEFKQLSRHEEAKMTGQEDEYYAASTIIEKVNPVVYNGKIYFYYGNHYITNDDILRRIISDTFPGFKTRYTDEVLKQIEYRADLTPEFPIFKIKLKNGYLSEGHFIEGDYTDFTPYYIDIKYDPNAKPVKIVDEYLDNLSGNDPEYKRFITDIIGHCLITDPSMKRAVSKFFIFIGTGGEGKGTFLNIVARILGELNCSRVDITQLNKESYFSTLDLKLANLGDDAENAPIDGSQMKKLKNIATSDTVAMRNLYENPRVARPIATLIFTTNYILKSYDKDESYKRRVVWCPMFSKPKHKIKNFVDLITTPECLRYWIKMAVEGYMRIYASNGMEIPQKVIDYTKKYHEDNDNMTLFVDSLEDDDIIGKRSPQLYGDYKTWAEDNGYQELSSKHMLKTIREQRGFDTKVKRVGGTPMRVFTRIEKEENENE